MTKIMLSLSEVIHFAEKATFSIWDMLRHGRAEML